MNLWHIAIPCTLLHFIINWYHHMFAHSTFMTRLNTAIATHFYHPTLKAQVQYTGRTCEACQCIKLPGAGYGELPPRNALLLPWSEVTVDLIGPLKITVCSCTSDLISCSNLD